MSGGSKRRPRYKAQAKHKNCIKSALCEQDTAQARWRGPELCWTTEHALQGEAVPCNPATWACRRNRCGGSPISSRAPEAIFLRISSSVSKDSFCWMYRSVIYIHPETMHGAPGPLHPQKHQSTQHAQQGGRDQVCRDHGIRYARGRDQSGIRYSGGMGSGMSGSGTGGRDQVCRDQVCRGRD